MNMEKLPIKLKELSPLMIELIEKVQQLDSTYLTKQQKAGITEEMRDIVDKFRDYFAKASQLNEMDEQRKIFNERIERALSVFEWESNVAVTPYKFKKFSENGKTLLSSILKLLGARGCGILIIETYLKLCVKTINQMTEETSVNKTNFKLILESFGLTANMFKKYWHISFQPNQKSTIMLCLHQICKGLPMLLKMIENNNTDVKKFALNMLTKCLNRILEEIHSDGNLQSKNCGQEFIILMDTCLYKLNEISNFNSDLANLIEKANEIMTCLKPMIDELLCYVMSIAQVTSFEIDKAGIMSASKKVLQQFKELNAEVEDENTCSIKLNACSLGEALCNLEQQVNTAVLRLVLEVFSGVNSPLKNIVNQCRTNIAKDNKVLEDLNVLISDFDVEMDKIMQIGLFAISCTSSLNRILKIQSCLASLESLETELIPSLTALYLDCNSRNKSNFQYLIDFWLKEITELKNLIDSILDPAGFCGVVRNQIKNLVVDFKEDMSLNKAKSILKQIIRYSRKLVKTLKISMEDDEISDATDECVKNFQIAIQECEGVLDLINKEGNEETLARASKRCDYLLSKLNKLSTHLFELAIKESDFEAAENSEETLIPNIEIPQKNYYKLCDIEAFSSPSDLEILTPYINKGIVRSKKRNILYKTESAIKQERCFDETLLQAQHWDKTPVSRKRSRCCKPLNLNLELGNTIDLEMSTVLENVSELNNEYLKSLSPIKKHNDHTKDVGCGTEKDIDYVKPVLTNSGCCAKLDLENEKIKSDSESEQNRIGDKLRSKFQQSLDDLSKNTSLILSTDSEGEDLDTPDRLQDLKIVEQKIDFLKQQIPGVLP